MERPTCHLSPSRISSRIAAIVAVSLFGSPLSAMTSTLADQVPTTTVTYSASDLATEQGLQVLYRRIVLAARSVCPDYDSQDLEAAQASWACQRKAVADAVRQIDSPRLTAIQALHPGHS